MIVLCACIYMYMYMYMYIQVSTDVLADECPVTPPLEPERKESITFSVKPKLTTFQDPDSTQLVGHDD